MRNGNSKIIYKNKTLQQKLRSWPDQNSLPESKLYSHWSSWIMRLNDSNYSFSTELQWVGVAFQLHWKQLFLFKLIKHSFTVTVMGTGGRGGSKGNYLEFVCLLQEVSQIAAILLIAVSVHQIRAAPSFGRKSGFGSFKMGLSRKLINDQYLTCGRSLLPSVTLPIMFS